MTGALEFDRITHVPNLMGGRPTIRGMRVTVAMVLGELASGRTSDEILADFAYLEAEDIQQCIRYAGRMPKEHEIDPS